MNKLSLSLYQVALKEAVEISNAKSSRKVFRIYSESEFQRIDRIPRKLRNRDMQSEWDSVSYL